MVFLLTSCKYFSKILAIFTIDMDYQSLHTWKSSDLTAADIW